MNRFRGALLVAFLLQASLSYMAMSGDKLQSGTLFSATVKGANYAEIPEGLSNITAHDPSGKPLNFSVNGDRLAFTGGYAHIEGTYPAYVCDYSYMPRALKGVESDSFIVDICSDGKPVFVDGFTFTGLPADRRIAGIVYYPYYPYAGETNVTRLASAEEPLYFDVLNYTYAGGVLNINQRLLVNPSNWSNIFLLVFEDPGQRFGGAAPAPAEQKNSSTPPNPPDGFVLPIGAALAASVAIAIVVVRKHVRR